MVRGVLERDGADGRPLGALKDGALPLHATVMTAVRDPRRRAPTRRLRHAPGLATTRTGLGARHDRLGKAGPRRAKCQG
jgi:hypothetical protein